MKQDNDIRAAAVTLGRLGGKSRSPSKRAAATANARARWAGRAPSWFRGESAAGWGAVVRDADTARLGTAERYGERPDSIRVWAYTSRADAYDGRRGTLYHGGSYYRIRHTSSGLYLHVRYVAMKIELQMRQIYLASAFPRAAAEHIGAALIAMTADHGIEIEPTEA